MWNRCYCVGANACNCSKGGSSPGDCACLDDKLSLLVAGAMSLGLVSWAVYSLRKRLREEPDASDPTAGTGDESQYPQTWTSQVSKVCGYLQPVGLFDFENSICTEEEPPQRTSSTHVLPATSRSCPTSRTSSRATAKSPRSKHRITTEDAALAETSLSSSVSQIHRAATPLEKQKVEHGVSGKGSISTVAGQRKSVNLSRGRQKTSSKKTSFAKSGLDIARGQVDPLSKRESGPGVSFHDPDGSTAAVGLVHSKAQETPNAKERKHVPRSGVLHHDRQAGKDSPSSRNVDRHKQTQGLNDAGNHPHDLTQHSAVANHAKDESLKRFFSKPAASVAAGIQQKSKHIQSNHILGNSFGERQSKRNVVDNHESSNVKLENVIKYDFEKQKKSEVFDQVKHKSHVSTANILSRAVSAIKRTSHTTAVTGSIAVGVEIIQQRNPVHADECPSDQRSEGSESLKSKNSKLTRQSQSKKSLKQVESRSGGQVRAPANGSRVSIGTAPAKKDNSDRSSVKSMFASVDSDRQSRQAKQEKMEQPPPEEVPAVAKDSEVTAVVKTNIITRAAIIEPLEKQELTPPRQKHQGSDNSQTTVSSNSSRFTKSSGPESQFEMNQPQRPPQEGNGNEDSTAVTLSRIEDCDTASQWDLNNPKRAAPGESNPLKAYTSTISLVSTVSTGQHLSRRDSLFEPESQYEMNHPPRPEVNETEQESTGSEKERTRAKDQQHEFQSQIAMNQPDRPAQGKPRVGTDGPQLTPGSHPRQLETNQATTSRQVEPTAHHNKRLSLHAALKSGDEDLGSVRHHAPHDHDALTHVGGSPLDPHATHQHPGQPHTALRKMEDVAGAVTAVGHHDDRYTDEQRNAEEAYRSGRRSSWALAKIPHAAVYFPKY